MTQTIKHSMPFEGGFLAMEYSISEHGYRGLKADIFSHVPADGSRQSRQYRLEFNSIGEGDPLAFLCDLDEDYIVDNIFGLTEKQFDIVKTVSNLRTIIEEAKRDHELSSENFIALEDAIDTALTHFDGNHELACRILISSLQLLAIPGFTDDIHHIASKRQSNKVFQFMKDVWEPMVRGIELYPHDTPFDELDQAPQPSL